MMKSVFSCFLVSVCMLVLLACFIEVDATRAGEAPFTGTEGEPQDQLDWSACGLIETSWTDPDWVMVTSDRILRSHDCIAECAECPECWYDLPFQPCYPENRYWKFEENSGSAYAFPMAALGIGTFDGLYLRRTVKFQLYSGADESTPYGPEMMGPAYISIDHWRDVFPACEGFEPGTFFVTGGAGALADYSIKIGGDTDIEDVDVKRDDNMSEHHTDRFGDDFVLRRGAPFEVDVRLGREYGPGCHEVYFEAVHDFDGGETTIDIPPLEAPPAEGEWGAEFLSATTNGDDTKTVSVRIHIPADVAIGEYDFKVLVRNKGTADPTDEYALQDPVIILFNPWCTSDEVSLSSGAQRQEYVLNENGIMWRGKYFHHLPKSWRFAQFNHSTLELAMDLLDGVSASDRADAGLVSRHFSKVTNSQDDNGVIVGNWGDDYSGGTSPLYWSGSDQLINQYLPTKTPVRYGQCWVYGGVLTTFLRCIGIPTRPLSNFESGHDADKPVNKVVDFYLNSDFSLNRIDTRDSKWNYHVWCDAWIGGGWNAVDGTPQEPSGGAYQLGPAPHASIKGDLGGLYDVDFVVAEVDADIKYWYDLLGVYVLWQTNTTLIGRNITTKAVGGSAATDITSAYKTPEAIQSASPDPQVATTALPVSGVEITIDVPEIVVLGSDIVWGVMLTNNSVAAETVRVAINGSAVAYDGSFLGAVDAVSRDVELDPAESDSVKLTIPPSTYLAWTGITDTFEAVIGGMAVGTGEGFVDIRSTLVTTAQPVLTLTGPQPLPAGSSVNLAVDWDNPLSSDLHNVLTVFSVGEGLSIAGESDVEIIVGDLAAGGHLFLSQDITGVGGGVHYATVTIFADEIHSISADEEITVFEDCNGNDIPDSVDIDDGPSEDCNNNRIPDECEEDCNGNGVPDDCDVEADPTLDCNGNGVPDECDLDSGTSLDENDNEVPDECEEDCNLNGIPDDLDIARGTSSDFNSNGVPDECDDDCNMNGIPDEIDISLGDSSDDNFNGVPDECEVVNLAPVAYRPHGPRIGTMGTRLNYAATADDPETDQVYHEFDWGDGSTSGWVGPSESGSQCTQSHEWSSSGRYEVRVRAKDSWGHVGEWSEPLLLRVLGSEVRPMRETNLGHKLDPTNRCVDISYSLANDCEMSLEIYDTMGRKVGTLAQGDVRAGSYSVTWDTRGQTPGVYFCRLIAGNKIITHKVVVVR
jgi:hypothetical protein